MTMQSKISILSSFATDRLFDAEGRLVGEVPGGPALYLTNVLRREGVPFVLLAPNARGVVEIRITTDGEAGRIIEKPEVSQIDFSSIATPVLLISSLCGEFSLEGLSRFQGRVFLDVQGYVNDPLRLGGKIAWKPSSKVVKSTSCLKGTDQEIQQLPAAVIEAQKKKMLIITRGSNGCELFLRGERFPVKPSSVVETKNAIGAGDTFFATFVAGVFRMDDPLGSICYATERTSEFLANRAIHHPGRSVL